jgi:hypothetical protein
MKLSAHAPECQNYETTSEQRTQSSPPLGLDRIDQRDTPLDGEYRYTYDGAGVQVYIMDSGIWSDHDDFSGRNVTCGFTAFEVWRGEAKPILLRRSAG